MLINPSLHLTCCSWVLILPNTEACSTFAMYSNLFSTGGNFGEKNYLKFLTVVINLCDLFYKSSTKLILNCFNDFVC